MSTSISFIIGRNPFERLVSAFNDKILNARSGTSFETVCFSEKKNQS